MMEYKFYDTCSLLLKADNLFDEEDRYRTVISTITLQELEDIKTSSTKDPDIKYSARKILNILNNNPDKYEVWIFKDEMLDPIVEKGFTHINNDLRILAAAFNYDTYQHPDETIFVTNDLALKVIANCFFGEDSIMSVKEEQFDQYTGYKEIIIDNDQELAYFYEHPDINHYNLITNQYLLIKYGDEIVDRFCWTGETHRRIAFRDFWSKWFGSISPYKNDNYQMFLADSLSHNQITFVRGPAGTGKTYLSLGYLFSQLEQHKIDKIIIFCNTVAVKGSAKLGYYPGTRDDKLLDSQIGNLLISKLGDRMEVERLIQEEKLLLLPVSDIRGYDTTGMRAGIYISEAQNMSVALMKLALQRIGEDSICVIDGDDKTQVDSLEFAGINNGMKRAMQVFRGDEVYGEVQLQNIYRSHIAAIAEQM